MIRSISNRVRVWAARVTMVVALLWYIKVFADVPADPSKDPTSALDQIYQAIVAKKWGLLAVLLTMGLVALVRFIAPRLHDAFGAWVQTQRVSAILALVTGGTMAMATQLMQGGQFSIKLIVYGFSIGVGAIGGYNVLWDILFPADSKKPAPASSILPKS